MQHAINREVAEREAPKDDRPRLRGLAREVMGEMERLFTQNLQLSKTTIRENEDEAKKSFLFMSLAVLLSLVGLVSLIRTLSLYLGETFAWSNSAVELFHACFNILLATIFLLVGRKALQKLGKVPQKIAQQWKEEWQWLHKNL